MLSEQQINEQLRRLPQWELIDKKICRKVTLKNFSQALALVNAIGELAEAADHHPDLAIHNYNRVIITLFTHSAGGLESGDFYLADRIESLIQGWPEVVENVSSKS